MAEEKANTFGISDGELLKMAVERSQVIFPIWALYVTVVGGIVVLLSSDVHLNPLNGWALTGVFVLFALSNLHAITNLGDQRTQILKMMSRRKFEQEAEQKLLKALTPPPNWMYRTFHLTFDAIVAAAILYRFLSVAK